MKSLLTILIHAERQSSVRKAHRSIRAAGSSAIFLAVAGMTAYSLAFAAPPAPDERAHAEWRESMLHKETPGEGCFQAAFPAIGWVTAPCHAVSGRTHPLPRVIEGTGPQTVGNRNDYALVAPGANLITKTVGSFPSVEGVTSESSVGVASFGGGGVLGSNEYTLQINTNSNSTTSACSGGASGCTVWQQYLYAPDQLVSGSGGVFIQYWLLGYGAGGASCPSGYTTSKTSCYLNSAAVEAPDTPITGLGNLQLTGTAASGGNDTVIFFNGTTAYNVTALDSVLKIATVWTQSEFNVVGDAGGSEAIFNTGSVITVNVAALYGSSTAPTCASGAGTTGETNNLNLLPCSATGGTTPSVQFIESLISDPTISKAFSPTTIIAGGSSTVTLTLTNPNTGISLTDAAFTDTLVNMSASGGAVGGTCAGTTPGTLSAGATALSFSGITIPAGASCTITFPVTSIILGVHTNATSGVSSDQALTGGISNTAILSVTALPATISKAFNPASITTLGTSTVTLTLNNPNVIPLTGAAFTDMLVNMSAFGGAVVSTCPGITPNTLSAGATALSFSGIALSAGGSCAIAFTIASTHVGTNPNTTSGVSTDEAATGSVSNTANLIVIPGTIYISDSQNDRIRIVNTATDTINTQAGNGTGGFAGDGGAATSAELKIPFGVAVDSAGNTYIADAQNNRVRMVSIAGTIATVAGNGHAGSGGDGGPAVSASLNNPSGVAVDAAGNLYIADQYNNKIRLVTTAGVISTFAGTGTVGNGGDGGHATAAELYDPAGVALDGLGSLYIADTNNHRIRKVNISTGTITTVAGSGAVGYGCAAGVATAVGLHNPFGVAADGLGNIYIADTYNQCIRKVASGNITTLAGNGVANFGGDGGPATSAALNYPTGVAVDGVGNIYIADVVNNRVRMVTPAGTITTLAGTGLFRFSGDGGPATGAGLYNPTGVAAR
jgi:hypothetical protein